MFFKKLFFLNEGFFFFPQRDTFHFSAYCLPPEYGELNYLSISLLIIEKFIHVQKNLLESSR